MDEISQWGIAALIGISIAAFLAWFNNCLVDADKANNTAGWQWIAGSGADAAPYFRIFNPITPVSYTHLTLPTIYSV